MTGRLQPRFGERNGRARLTDDEVDEMRSLREDEIILPGKPRYWTYKRLAQRYGVSRSSVQMICEYMRRTNIPDRW